MKITYDPYKNKRNIEERGISFDRAVDVFNGLKFEFVDERFDYGEERIITIGSIEGRMVVLVWTERGDARHIISLRKANEKEHKKYKNKLG